jgi:hypothetical protein
MWNYIQRPKWFVAHHSMFECWKEKWQEWQTFMLYLPNLTQSEPIVVGTVQRNESLTWININLQFRLALQCWLKHLKDTTHHNSISPSLNFMSCVSRIHSIWRKVDIVSPSQTLLLSCNYFVTVFSGRSRWQWLPSNQLHLLPRSRMHGALCPLYNVP